MKLSLCVVLLCCLTACFDLPPDSRKPASPTPSALDSRFILVDGFEKKFDLTKKEDVKTLQNRFQEMLKLVKSNARPQDSANGIWPLYFIQNEELSDKKLKKSLNFMLDQLLAIEEDRTSSSTSIIQFQEMNRALLMNFISPLADHYSSIMIAKLFVKDVFSHPFLTGTKPAQAVSAILWEDEGEISKKSLKLGFNRKELSINIDHICDYSEPKSSYGTRPGFTMKCDGKKIKIKFKEISSEPFMSRILWALGYHIEPVDYVPSMRVHYDRRILDEFNSRKKMPLRITFWGRTIVERSFARTYDAVDYMDHLVLKDASVIPQSEIHDFLIDENGEYRKSNEDRIAEVVTVAAQIQESRDEITKVGPWSFNDFDHMDRREIRALVVLAAWLNWYDVRFDNNRTVLEEDSKGEVKMKMYIGDAGAAMGSVSKLLHFIPSKIENAELFSERFTTTHQGKFRIKNYFQVYDENKAFNEATLEDAQWIGKLMLKLKPEQIHEALSASGFTPEEIKLYETKLFKRLEFMKQDLGL